ncbi:glycine-rich family protein [Populus alba x Populus x berolinensis]|uniref:Glycine-rich family protein n=1 Tax=Populus alba x Populus x berolinensis TaxID=444605 RepID=A0AAD6WDP6_9ROSI|nr:glycine-rich family protein [Populus alba x Populus x berolinensis]
MARCYCILVLIALVIAQASARDVPKDAGLNDQKNLIAYGGVGGFAGVGGLGGALGGGVGGGVGGGLGGGCGDCADGAAGSLVHP